MHVHEHSDRQRTALAPPSAFIGAHPRFRFIARAAFIGAMLLCAPAAHALKSDAQQPINIRARSVAANEKTGVSVYRGDVVMTQGSLRIEADRLEVTLHNGRTDLIRAWGKPARLRSRTDAGDDIHASAARVEYRATAGQVDLYDNVAIERGADQFTAAVVHYLIEQQTFTAEGGDGNQVTATIQPAKRETSP